MEINGNLQSRRPDQSVQGPTTVCASPHNAHAENAPQARPQVIGNCRTRFFVEVSAVENYLFNPNSFNPNSSFTPKMWRKVMKGWMKNAMCFTSRETLVTSSVANSAFWNPKCPSERDSFQRETPFQPINPNHQTTTGCTSWLWQEHLGLTSEGLKSNFPIWK